MFHQERLIAELALTVILYYTTISLIDNMLAWLSINPFKPQVLSLFLWFFLFHYIRFAVIKSDINHYNKCMQGSNYMTTTTRCTHSLVTLFGTLSWRFWSILTGCYYTVAADLSTAESRGNSLISPHPTGALLDCAGRLNTLSSLSCSKNLFKMI